MKVTDHTWDGENVPTVYKDWLGQEVRVGDYVCYAISQSHSASMVMGKILEFRVTDASGDPLGRKTYDYDAEPTIVPNRYGDRKVYPEYFQHQWKFKIQPILDSRYSYRSNQTGVGPRAVVIGTIENVLKVDVSQAEFEEYE